MLTEGYVTGMATVSHFLASSAASINFGWVGHVIFAIAGGIGYAGYGLITKDRSPSKFVKDFAWGAVSMLLVTFVLSYFFHDPPPWFDF